MSQAVNHIVILGGGTAGWLTASLLASEHGSNITVTLIESPDIPIIGVGEGTWPSMRSTLQKIGVSEHELLSRCDATFKQGTEFINWVSDSEPNRYYHPFSLPADYSSINLAEHWLASEVDTDFCATVTPQASAILQCRAPKTADVPEYAFHLNYGYHFDASKLSQWLMGHATNTLGVKHILANLVAVNQCPDGEITSLSLDSGVSISGDLYVDCSGQRALLIGEAMDVPLYSIAHVLPNDRAIATQVPYSDPAAEIASVTRSTAQASGWIWDIGLQSRRGVGYVHSSAHVSEDEASTALLSYIASSDTSTQLNELNVRSIPFNPARREVSWYKNCVAIGLSAGFIEPLEASSIALIEQAANRLCEILPLDQQSMTAEAAAFNQQMARQWAQVEEFLQLHYVLSQRDDSEYWRAVRNESAILPDLRDKLKTWARRPAWHQDAPRYDELFPAASYQYVLYGMAGRHIRPNTSRRTFQVARPQADKAMFDVRQRSSRIDALPGNRALLTALRSGKSLESLEGAA